MCSGRPTGPLRGFPYCPIRYQSARTPAPNRACEQSIVCERGNVMSYLVGVDVGATFTTAAVVRGGRAEVVSVVPTQLPGVPRGFLSRVGDDTPVLVGARPVPAE